MDTIMSGRLKRFILGAAAMIAVAAVGASERVDVDGAIACAKERDDARRLACYDKAVAGVEAPVTETPSAPAAVVAPEQEFGVEGGAVARQRRSEQERQSVKTEVQSITAAVTEVTSRPHGELVLSLDNGQIWVQKSPEPRFPIKPGDRVKINAGMLGSFRLINGKRSTQVTRLK